MVDGVVQIPLPGRSLAVDAAPCRVGGAGRGHAVRPRPSAVAVSGTRSVPATLGPGTRSVPNTLDATRQDAASTNFLAGPENRLVEVAVRAVVGGQADGYNPLVLYGPSGTGKSHLALGLAAAWKDRDVAGTRRVPDHRPHTACADYIKRRRVVCTTAVDFARELADAIETQSVEEFRAKHRGAAMLVVEDLGQLATRKSGKLCAEEELVHTLDALAGEGRWVVVTAVAPPWELPGIVPMLQSRLTAGLVVRLAPPEREARLALLEQLAAILEIELPEPVACVLADGLSGTARDLAGALLELRRMAEADDGPEETGDVCSPAFRRHPAAKPPKGGTTNVGTAGTLDLAAARQYVAGRNRGRQTSVHEIALATARHFSLRLSDLRSPSRRRVLVAARGVAVYLARHAAGHRLEEIGRYFGGRDHTTVMHSYRTTKELIAADPATRAAIDQLRAALRKT